MCGCLSHTPHLGNLTTTQARALTGNQTSDPLVCRPVLRPLSCPSQGANAFNESVNKGIPFLRALQQIILNPSHQINY